MPVQFHCSACSKPIEVDDEFAGQAVTCPYCRNVMHAPAGQAPLAATSGATGVPSPQVFPGSTLPPSGQPSKSNWFASAALLCAILLIVLFCIATAGWSKVVRDIAPDMQVKPEQMPQLLERTSKEPLLVVSSFLMLLDAILGVLFGILGLTRRTGRRWQAIVGLVVCGLMLACSCLSIIMNYASLAAGKSH